MESPVTSTLLLEMAAPDLVVQLGSVTGHAHSPTASQRDDHIYRRLPDPRVALKKPIPSGENTNSDSVKRQRYRIHR